MSWKIVFKAARDDLPIIFDDRGWEMVRFPTKEHADHQVAIDAQLTWDEGGTISRDDDDNMYNGQPFEDQYRIDSLTYEVVECDDPVTKYFIWHNGSIRFVMYEGQEAFIVPINDDDLDLGLWVPITESLDGSE